MGNKIIQNSFFITGAQYHYYMYAAIDTLLEPQATTAVCLGHFTAHDTLSLVTLKTDRVELYEYDRQERLMLRHRHQLAAPCLSAVRVGGLCEDDRGRRDGLLLCFEGSRYSTIAFDPQTCTFTTVSLHQYNEERFGGGEGGEGLSTAPECRVLNVAAVERSGRCAVLRVHRDHFAIVPFDRLVLDDTDTKDGDIERLPSWVLRFAQVDTRLTGVIDWCFLDGYSEPTIGLLLNQNGRPAWTGRSVTNKRDNIAYAIVAIDLRNQTVSVIHYQEGLPNDLQALFPCDKPIGGCFAVGTSALVHLEQGSQGCGFAMNAFASKLSDYRFLPILDPLEVTIENGWMVHVNKDVFWLCLTDGTRLSVKVTKGSRFVNNIVVSRLLATDDQQHQPITCSSSLDGFIVVGSDCGDTVLYRRADLHTDTTTQPAITATNSHFDENDLYLAEMELEERQRTAPDQQNQLTLVDTLPSTGTFNDVTVSFGANHVNVERPISSRSPRQFVAVIGRGPSTNGIAVISPHLPLRESARFPVPGATALFVLGSGNGEKFLLVSTPHSTLVLKMTSATGGALEEVEESDFYLEGATMAAGMTTAGLHVQVYATGVRLLKGTEMVHEEPFTTSRCLKATCLGDLVAVIDNKLTDRVFAVDANCGLRMVHQGRDCVSMGMFDRDGVCYYYRLTRQGVFTINDNTGSIFTNHSIGLLPHLLTTVDTDQTQLPEHIQCVSRDGSVHIIVAVKGQVAVYSDRPGAPWHFVKKESRLLRVGSLSVPFVVNQHTAVAANCGNKMWFILIGHRGYPRFHPITGNVSSVAALGGGQLLFVDRSSRVRIAIIDDRFDVDRADGAVMVKRFGDNLQPHRIVYLPAVNAFVVTRRSPHAFTLPTDDYSADADHPDFEYAKGAPTPHRHHYHVSVLSPISWTITDSLSIADQTGCSEYDAVVDMRVCVLSTKAHQSGRKALVVVGLVAQKAEDRPVRGRCLVLDVTEVVPEPGRPETNRRLRLLCSADMKTTVGAVCELKGAVLVSQGARIIVYAFENDDFSNDAIHAIHDKVLFNEALFTVPSLPARFKAVVV